jgi:putative sterol carrier protein
MAAQLKNESVRGTVQFYIGERGNAQCFSLEVGGGACTVQECAKEGSAAVAQKRTVRIGTREKTWMEMARGSLAPWDALNRGEILIRGDFELARALAAVLAVTEAK